MTDGSGQQSAISGQPPKGPGPSARSVGAISGQRGQVTKPFLNFATVEDAQEAARRLAAFEHVLASLTVFVDGQWLDEYGRLKNSRAFVEAKHASRAAIRMAEEVA